MSKKSKRSSAQSHPQNGQPSSMKQSLAEIFTELQELRETIDQLEQTRSEKQNTARRSDEGLDQASVKEQFVESLLHLVEFIEQTTATNTSNPFAQANIETLARALILSGQGEKFEPAVEMVIRNYCEVCKEIRLYRNKTELSQDLKDDIEAAFTRILEQHRLELRDLAVEIEEVEAESKFRVEQHQIVEEIPTRKTELFGKVAECITPMFRWKNGNGVERNKPATIVLYSRRTKSHDANGVASTPLTSR